MSILVSMVLIALTCVLVVQLLLTPIVLKKWSLITLLTLSIALRILGLKNQALDTTQFLWFVYDVGIILWLFLAVERAKRLERP